MMRRPLTLFQKLRKNADTASSNCCVSVLTSIDATALSQVGVTDSPADSVARLVKLAEASQVDGVVASPLEVKTIRTIVMNPSFLIVTPGIRPGGDSSNAEDQKRISTPSAALAAGSNYLVVGRPITAAKDPATAAHAILAEMEGV